MTNSSGYFNASIQQSNLKVPESDLHLLNESLTGTVERSGLKRKKTKVPLSILRYINHHQYHKTMNHEIEIILVEDNMDDAALVIRR
jgi:CBS-domain-containing membrane protein